MIWKILPKRMWVLSLFLVSVFGVVFYLILGRGAETSTTQQLLRRELALTRAEAGNLMTFFQLFGASVNTLARLSSMEGRDMDTIKDLDAFVDQWYSKGFVKGVLLADSKGEVQFNSNIMRVPDIGTSVADRDYFLWAKEQKEENSYFVGQPVVSRIGATKDKVIIPVTSPVFQDGVFAGVVTSAAELEPLAEHYLQLLKISDETRVYMINEKGELLYNNFDPETLGLNVYEPSPDRPFWGNRALITNFENAISASQEGKMRAAYLNTKTGLMEEHLVAYSPVVLEGQNWLLIMSSPVKNVTTVNAPIYIKQTGVLLLVYMTVLLFGLIVNRESKLQSRKPTH